MSLTSNEFGLQKVEDENISKLYNAQKINVIMATQSLISILFCLRKIFYQFLNGSNWKAACKTIL